MPHVTYKPKILFAVNEGSGNNTIDYAAVIDGFFEDKQDATYKVLKLQNDDIKTLLKSSIQSFDPNIIVAVGGDGTIKLIAEMVLDTDITIGVIPAGSANGMAKELGIPQEPLQALELIYSGSGKPIHLTKINNQICIHLSDIGFNASLVKRFQNTQQRGMLGYLKAAWSTLWRHSNMEAAFTINNQTIKRNAVMIVVANATSYGMGITINPLGKLDDALFEIVIIRKISISEIIKMRLSRGDFHPDKTEVFQTDGITIRSRRKVHFQVDGEYYGKVNELIAKIMPKAIRIIY